MVSLVQSHIQAALTISIEASMITGGFHDEFCGIASTKRFLDTPFVSFRIAVREPEAETKRATIDSARSEGFESENKGLGVES